LRRFHFSLSSSKSAPKGLQEAIVLRELSTGGRSQHHRTLKPDLKIKLDILYATPLYTKETPAFKH
jgi:hypothetical protein